MDELVLLEDELWTNAPLVVVVHVNVVHQVGVVNQDRAKAWDKALFDCFFAEL